MLKKSLGFILLFSLILNLQSNFSLANDINSSEKIEQKVEKNSFNKFMAGFITGIILGGGGYLCYDQFIVKPRDLKNKAELNKILKKLNTELSEEIKQSRDSAQNLSDILINKIQESDIFNKIIDALDGVIINT